MASYHVFVSPPFFGASCVIQLPEIVFTPGRVDCPTSPETSEDYEFPHFNMESAELFDYFDRHFDFDPVETTSLMGAHGMGQMTKV